MQEKDQIIAIIQNYWHFFVIAGLVVWVIIQADKVAELQLQKSAHNKTIRALNATLIEERKRETDLRKELKEINNKITDLNEIYNNLPTDKQIKSDHPYLSPNSSWNAILRPINDAINEPPSQVDSINTERRYYANPE